MNPTVKTLVEDRLSQLRQSLDFATKRVEEGRRWLEDAIETRNEVRREIEKLEAQLDGDLLEQTA